MKWVRVQDALPKNNDQCLIYTEKEDAATGPVTWKDDPGGWLDVFATPEAGAFYTVNTVTHWALWVPPEKDEQ